MLYRRRRRRSLFISIYKLSKWVWISQFTVDEDGGDKGEDARLNWGEIVEWGKTKKKQDTKDTQKIN